MLSLAEAHGFKIAILLVGAAAYFPFSKYWNTGQNYMLYVLLATAAGSAMLRQDAIEEKRKAVAEEQAKRQEEEEFKRSMAPGTCDRLRSEPQSYRMIEQACYRMYPTDSWADNAGRATCISNEHKTMAACGVNALNIP